MKQVPQKDAALKLNDAGTWIREDISYEVNEPDAYALEEALRQKEKHGGEVVAITAGPARAQQVLREALAKGAIAPSISKTTSSSLSIPEYCQGDCRGDQGREVRHDLHRPAIRRLWLRADRRAALQLLGWPHATIIMQIEKSEGGIKVKRELEGGFFQYVNIPLPAVLTIQSGINKLRYATLIGIKQAKNKPLRKVTWAEVASALGENLQKIERLYVPQKTKQTEFLERDACRSGQEAGR